MMKSFNVMANIGKSRHVVNFHDGEKTHKDGSPFFDIQIFSRKKDMQAFVKELMASGYVGK